MKFDCSFGIFLNFANLICRSTDISKCFRGSLRLRDNESQLYITLSSLLKINEYTFRRGKFELSLASSLNTDPTDSTLSMEASHIIVFSFVKMSEKNMAGCSHTFKALFTLFITSNGKKKISKRKNMVQLLADG